MTTDDVPALIFRALRKDDAAICATIKEAARAHEELARRLRAHADRLKAGLD